MKRRKKKTFICIISLSLLALLGAYGFISYQNHHTPFQEGFVYELVESTNQSIMKLLGKDYVLNSEAAMLKRKNYELVTSYNQPVNDEGIAVDMLDNPYFNQKIKGYDYPEPKEISYHSTVTDTDRHAYVLLPVNYSTDKMYPVLYLMHGLGGSHRTWLNKDADIILYNLQYFYNAKEMIVVLPNNNVNANENTDDFYIGDKIKIYDKIEQDLVQCLMPYINEHFSTLTDKNNTAIAGNSMGGRETINIAFHHQDLFGHVGLFSSSYAVKSRKYAGIMRPLFNDLDVAAEHGGFKTLMLMVGRSDNVCGEWTYYYHDRLTANNVPHIFYTTEGGHQNKVWQNALYNFGLKIFK